MLYFVMSKIIVLALILLPVFDQFRLSMVLNMTESSRDMRIAETMQKLVKDKCFPVSKRSFHERSRGL